MNYIKLRNCVVTGSCAILELHKCKSINKFWYDLIKYFTTSVVLCSCVNTQVCTRYVNLLSKYELSKFDKMLILKFV